MLKTLKRNYFLKEVDLLTDRLTEFSSGEQTARAIAQKQLFPDSGFEISHCLLLWGRVMAMLWNEKEAHMVAAVPHKYTVVSLKAVQL